MGTVADSLVRRHLYERLKFDYTPSEAVIFISVQEVLFTFQVGYYYDGCEIKIWIDLGQCSMRQVQVGGWVEMR